MPSQPPRFGGGEGPAGVKRPGQETVENGRLGLESGAKAEENKNS